MLLRCGGCGMQGAGTGPGALPPVPGALTIAGNTGTFVISGVTAPTSLLLKPGAIIALENIESPPNTSPGAPARSTTVSGIVTSYTEVNLRSAGETPYMKATIVFTIGGEFEGNLPAGGAGAITGVDNAQVAALCEGLLVTGPGLQPGVDTTITGLGGGAVYISPAAVANPAESDPPAGIRGTYTTSPNIGSPGLAVCYQVYTAVPFRACTSWENVTSQFSSISLEISISGSAENNSTNDVSYVPVSESDSSYPGTDASTNSVNTSSLIADVTVTLRPFTGTLPDYMSPPAEGSPPNPAPILDVSYSGQTALSNTFLDPGTFIILKCKDCCSNCFYVLAYKFDPSRLTAMSSGGGSYEVIAVPGGNTNTNTVTTTNSGPSGTTTVETGGSGTGPIGIFPTFTYSDGATFCFQYQDESHPLGVLTLAFLFILGAPYLVTSVSGGDPAPATPTTGVNTTNLGQGETAQVNSCELAGTYVTSLTVVVPTPPTPVTPPNPVPPPVVTNTTTSGTSGAGPTTTTTTMTVTTSPDGTVTTETTSTTSLTAGGLLSQTTSTSVANPNGSQNGNSTTVTYDAAGNVISTVTNTSSRGIDGTTSSVTTEEDYMATVDSTTGEETGTTLASTRTTTDTTAVSSHLIATATLTISSAS